MAESVDAELESPEAFDIAREDILLCKMEEERERCDGAIAPRPGFTDGQTQMRQRS